MQKIKNKYFIIIAVLIVFLGFGIFKIKANQASQDIEYITATKQSIQTIVEADGQVEAEKKAELTFQVPGRITNIPVKVGDQVKKWQYLAGIDISDFQTMHKLSLEDYLIQRRNFDEKSLEEYKDTVITDTIKRDIGNEQSKLNKSVSYVELAYKDIKDANLYAPFDGVVTAINIEVGNLASVLSPAIIVQTTNQLELTANIAETDIGLIQVGQEVSYQLDAFENQTFQGEIESIEPAELVLGGIVYYKINISSNQLPENSKIGMSADIKIITEQKDNVLAIPYYSIYQREDQKAKIKVLNKNKVIEKEITLGVIDDNAYVEIIDGLNEGDQVVTNL